MLVAPVIADTRNIAEKLGMVIAAEQFCGLQYNSDVLNVWIDDRVHYSDKAFFNLLDAAISSKEQQQVAMSQSARMNHCNAVFNVVSYYGFLEHDGGYSEGVAYTSKRTSR